MSRRTWLFVAFLVLVVVLLLLPSCGDKEAIVDVQPSVLSGTWDGSVDGKSLRMELSEDASHTISGRVIVYWPNFADLIRQTDFC